MPLNRSTERRRCQNLMRTPLRMGENPDFVDLYMPFDPLLLFGDEGNGDHFGYRILGGKVLPDSFIFEWNHESDDRVWFATDLPDYFRRSVPKDG